MHIKKPIKTTETDRMNNNNPPHRVFMSQSCFLPVSVTQYRVFWIFDRDALCRENCMCRVVIIAVVLCVWVMDILYLEKIRCLLKLIFVIECVTMHIFGCTILLLSNTYQTETVVRTMRWQLPKSYGLFLDDWFIMTQSSINCEFSSGPAQIKRIEKRVKCG